MDNNLFYINTIVVFEQRKWALSKRHRNDEVQARALEYWLDNILAKFHGRIFAITTDIALSCAKLHVPNPRPPHDALIAATALVHDLT